MSQKQFIAENKDRFISELSELLRIPSISTLAENKADMIRTAEFIKQRLHDAGIKDVTIYETPGHPIVYAEWLGAPGKPTVLVYGHYDVQPVDPVDLWSTPPFEPVIKDGKIYARGATDDKGQMYMHIKSAETWLKTTGTLPVNIKFLIEGEEEIGSPSLEPFINAHKDLLKCDSVLISDTSLFAPGVPTLTYGLRGLCYMEVEVTGPNRDLHSGTYGGAVPNPVNILAGMIAKLHDKKGKVTIPGFYDEVVKLTKKERDNFAKLPFSEKKYAAAIGVKQLQGEEGFSTFERTWARPTLDCNGIFGGFTGQGAKTIIPSKATAKISMRLVANQSPKKISKLFEKYIKEIAPKSVSVKVTDLHGGDAALTPLDSKASIAASKAMERAFGKKTVYMREGGSIPIVAAFQRILKAPTVLMGMGLNTENLHSPNEHFNLNHFLLGIESSAYFFDEFSK
ncbi:MAG: dipeptidase [Ignavibacteriales bacterium]|nr:Succinyl-diaminopimelate desuccinylase [Ignavibacteriaceae bacterium]QOJ28565.1 MAG: dipeptidase [Ignavibacteriales bacterium]